MKPKPALLLLILTPFGPAFALGLGDASVRSHLGEPLRVSIPLLGAPKELEATCFSLKNGTDAHLPGAGGARVELVRKGGEATLSITGSETVNEPVLQFSVAADCAQRLERNYVLLLDPPGVEAPPVAPAGAESQPAVAYPDHAPPPRLRPAKSTTPHKRPVDASVMPSLRPRHAAPRPKPRQADGPRLVLSGSHRALAGAADSSLALRLDTDLPDLSRARSQGVLTPTELSDENTSLTRKLAHLEAQLTALERRNRALEAMQAAKPAPQPARGWQAGHWPLTLAALTLLTGGFALATWLRRRGRHVVTQAPGTAWPGLDTAPSGHAQAGDEDIMEPAMSGEPASTPTPAPVPHVAAPYSQIAEDAGTEVKEDVLDQAEVYVAFGHANLAIHLLQEHLREAPTESPVPWLLLLDLLKRDGLEAEYQATAKECQRHFNINLSSDTSAPSVEHDGLEAYPHILDRLQALWGTPQITHLLHELMYDNRGGTRMGFEPGAYRDIVLLHEIIQERALSLAA